MKILFLFSALLVNFYVQSQVPKLANQVIWKTLYPGNQKFDNSGRLIKNKDGDTETKTSLGHIFYYKKNNLNKVAVVLFTNFWSSGEKNNCHACATSVGIATFTLSSTNTWIKTKFVEDWQIPQEGYGIEPPLQLRNYKNVPCFYIKYDRPPVYEYYYDIETLKPLK
jgi:hypothetical protein